MYFWVWSVGGSTVKYYNTSVLNWTGVHSFLNDFSLTSHKLCDSNKALDYNQDNSSPEQRRAMFDSVNTHHYNSINFEEFLQVIIL